MWLNIPIRLNRRNGASSNLIFGRETNAHETAPTQGSVGINRSFTHNSPSMSKLRIPTGALIGIIPDLRDRDNSTRAPPV